MGVGPPRAPWALRLLSSGLPAPLLQPQWLMPGLGVPASLTDGAVWLLFIRDGWAPASHQIPASPLLRFPCTRGVSLFHGGRQEATEEAISCRPIVKCPLGLGPCPLPFFSAVAGTFRGTLLGVVVKIPMRGALRMCGVILGVVCVHTKLTE